MSASPRPDDRLKSSPPSHEDEQPEVFAIRREGSRWALSRRDLLGAAAGTAVAGAIISVSQTGEDALAAPAGAEDVRWRSIYAHADAVRALAIGGGGRVLASGGMDKLVKLWQLPTGGHLKTLEPHTAGVVALAASPDGKTLASASLDGQVKIWSLPEGNLVKTLDAHKGSLRAIAFLPDGKTLVTGGFDDATIKLWPLPECANPQALNLRAYAMAVTPDGKMLAVACEDKTVKLLAIPGGNEIKSIGGHTRFILAMTTSPDGQWLASGGADEAVRLTSLPKGEAIASKAGQAGWINALGVSADGRMLAIGGGDRSAKVWSTADWRELHSLVGHRGAVSAVVFSPDGKLLASASHDRTIRLWSLDNGALLQCLADVQAIPVEVKTVRYRIRDHRQEWVTIIVPAGTTVPRGAECVCEAVPGEWKPPPVTVRPGGCDADAGAKAGDADCARKPACWCVSKPACGCDGDCKCQPVYVSCPCVNRPACGCVGHCSCMAVGGGGGGGTIHYWYPN